MKNLNFHHIGVATRSIDTEFGYFKSLGYIASSDFFVDSKQGIRGLFIEAKGQPRLELLENISDVGPLSPYLKKRVKFYHFAYETHDIEKDLEQITKLGGIVIVPITEATFFRKICFLMLKNMLMIELVQPYLPVGCLNGTVTNDR